jgi:glycosyltransferase involved in cell wall biosynthesis
MTISPAVSVILPVHNQEKYIARCLRSLLSQTLPSESYEIIVIDDGSTDRTPYVLERFTNDITLLQNSINCGLPASLNRAIMAARSPYIVRVDSDDYVNAHFLELLYLFLEGNPRMSAIACDYLLVNDSEEVLSRGNSADDPIACGIMFRTEHLIDIGLYDEEFLVHEERDLRVRFLQQHNICRLELPLYRYRRHETNMTNDLAAMDFHRALLEKKHPGKEV